LSYRADFISANEEADLVEHLRELPFRNFEFHGYLGNRRTVSYGWKYDFGQEKPFRADAIPDFLNPLRDRSAHFAGLRPDALEQVLVSEYAPGAGIGWHSDKAVFGDVIGISLLSACRFRLRRKVGAKWRRASFTAEQRSVYRMRGEARESWQHSIPSMDGLRYSITFRSLR
jgi:alkylated DNA repair dioxygenase AlkB